MNENEIREVVKEAMLGYEVTRYGCDMQADLENELVTAFTKVIEDAMGDAFMRGVRAAGD